jgi:Skp family chaperone for outer membrane proteins
MKTMKTPLFFLGLLLSLSLKADTKFINSLQCAEKIPGAKEVMVEGEKAQKVKMSELKDIEVKAQKLIGEIQKDRNDLVAKGSVMKADDKYKEEKKVKDKERKLEEMQGDYQRIVRDLETEMQMVQMRLQPFIVETIQTAQEWASKNPTVDAIWDNATKQYIYNKDSLDISGEIGKLALKRSDEKSTLAKGQAAKPATKTT